MDYQKQKCSLEEHKESEAISYCQECNIFMCNKCDKVHLSIRKNHHIFSLDKNVKEIFTSFSKEEKHLYELENIYKIHDRLYYEQSTTNIKNKGNTQHTNSVIRNAKVIVGEKKTNLKKNVDILEKLYKKYKIFIFFITTILSLLFIFLDLKKYSLFNNSYYPMNITLIENAENSYKELFFNLIDKSLNTNESLIKEEKEKLLNFLSEKNKKQIVPKNTIFCECKYKFDNLLIYLNKILFYSDIIGYNHVILDKKNFWFIRNTTYIEKYNLTIEVDDKSKYKNSFNNDVLYFNSCPFYHFIYKFKTDIRILYLKDEMLKNLPK